MLKVVVSGYFDPIHRGHIDHIRKAKQLGDYLIVIVSTDEAVFRKKGYCLMPLLDRMIVLRAIKYVDEVRVAIDQGNTVAQTLALLKPDIFAKGGDRTSDNEMPTEEVEICKKIGCRIVYGIGDKLNSSSILMKEAYSKNKSYRQSGAEYD